MSDIIATNEILLSGGSVRFAGVGRYLPERIVPSSEVAARCGVSTSILEERSGVRERRWADQKAGETASWMGAKAAFEALSYAEIEPDELDLIINASGTPEQAIPDDAPLLQLEMGLGESGISCMSVHSTCLSFLSAVDVAASFLSTGRYERILIVSSELASVGLNFEQPESSSLFGDAAAAAVLVRSETGQDSRLEAIRFETYGKGAHLTEIRGCGTRRPPNNVNTDPKDNLFDMNGPEILRMAMQHAPPFLENLRPGLTLDCTDIDVLIAHQPSAAGIAAFKQLGWSDEQIVKTLENLGNCVAASIPCTLYEAVQTQRLRRGDRFLMLGTGAGLSLGGIIGIF
jgi:3-oxoacyl-[acyl-carrier-protein] synthase III